MAEDRLYFFQFPEPFPTFVAQHSAPTHGPTEHGDKTAPSENAPPDSVTGKKVSFTQDTKPPAATAPQEPETATTTTPAPAKVDGVIGHLEVYASGAAKIRLANGILLDVSTQAVTNSVRFVIDN
jgi:DNA-directed RNA polymerase III subunit RPC4